MKKIVILALGLILTACQSNNASQKIDENNLEQAQEMAKLSGKYPVISFEKTEHDFGKIKQNQPVETIFKFTNTGEVPLVITEVQSTCGCTVPEKPAEPIAPGKTGEIKVRFNGSGKNQISKSITIGSNTIEQKTILTIKAFVE